MSLTGQVVAAVRHRLLAGGAADYHPHDLSADTDIYEPPSPYNQCGHICRERPRRCTLRDGLRCCVLGCSLYTHIMLNHRTFLKMFCCSLLIFPSLLTVRTLILPPWTLHLVFLYIFTKKLLHFFAFVWAGKESIITASQVFIQ